MTINTSRVSATVGSSRFEAEGPAEVVLSQYTTFIKSLKVASTTEAGPATPGMYVWQRFISIGVATTPAPELPLAVRFVTRFGPPCTSA